MSVHDTHPNGSTSVATVEPVVRRVIGSRIRDPHDQEDLVQEALVRLLRTGPALTDGALVAYAIVTARNVVITKGREDERHRRLQPKTFERPETDGTEEAAVINAERDAMAAALRTLPEQDRDALVAHDAEGVPLAVLAEEQGGTPGGMAARLNRTRARLRVEYLLAFRRLSLPTPACRSVLLSLSAGDRRRQQALGAGDHLLGCETCAALSEPLLSRRRPLAIFAPFVALGDWAKAHPVQAASGAGAAAVAAVVAVAVLSGSSPPPARTAPPPPPSPPPLVCGDLVAGRQRVGPSQLPAPAGQTVVAEDLLVQAVVGNGRAFWAGCGADRVLVEFEGATAPPPLQAGQHVSFQGHLSENPPGFDDKVGLGADPARAQLDQQGRHVDVDPAAVTVG